MTEFEARKKVEAKRDVHQAWARELRVLVPARLEEIDSEGRGRVVNLHDEEMEADHVPLLQMYAGDGYGEEHAHHLPERGYMLVADYPTIDTLDATGLTDGISQRREHMFQDGFFVPATFWNDEGSINSQIEEYLYKHKSGAIRRVSVDGEVEFISANGEDVIVGNGYVDIQQTDGQHARLDGMKALVEHSAGQRMRLNSSEARLDHADGHTARLDGSGGAIEHANGHEVTVGDSAVRVAFQRADGDAVRVDIDGQGATVSAPDEYNDQSTNPRAEVGVGDDGIAVVDGLARVGDSDAYREDRTTENTDANDPRTYAETTEPIAPIKDPADSAETAYSNPSTTSIAGAVDFGGYEFRNAVPERREADPDPAITDPTNPAFYPGEAIPYGYLWINIPDGVFRVWGTADAPVDIVTI